MNVREQGELHRLIDQAWALRGTGYLADAAAAIVDWHETRTARALDHRDQQRADALAVLRETTPVLREAEVLRALREVAVEVCPYCGAEHCRRDPDCDYRAALRAGVSERRARWHRAVAWRELIAAREATRAA